MSLSIIQDSRGNVSLFKVALIIIVVAGLIIFASFVAFNADQAQRTQPLVIDPPPGAQAWGGVVTYSDIRQSVYYLVPNSDIETVVSYYNDKLNQFYSASAADQNREVCKRFPPFGDHPDYKPGGSLVPYEYKCMFDNSGFNSYQWTQVIIQPGVVNSDPDLDTEGSVVIQYDQQWQR
ncbi:hypothetical protein MASR2M15_21600 [Anaerolineales bacterium]